MTPEQRYQHDLCSQGFEKDPSQARAVQALQTVYDEFQTDYRDKQGFWSFATRWDSKPNKKVQGLYLWGDVGRGKTYLVDCFYDCLTIVEKKRLHFHRFMQNVHDQLHQLKNTRNPLLFIAEQLAKDTKILCFDEFFVSDIADAMILGILFEAMISHDIILVATSNVHPDDLYKDGLQRSKFLPSIELIQRNCRILNVDGDTDYRFRLLAKAEIYHTPLDAQAETNLNNYFNALSPGGIESSQSLTINRREIDVIKQADGVIWCTFEALCNTPRSSHDYVEIARCFQTVLVSQIPQLNDLLNDTTRRFIALVDEFYDHNVKLIVSAASPVSHLYSGKRLAFEFQRTQSRLTEMQSKDYLGRVHIP